MMIANNSAANPCAVNPANLIALVTLLSFESDNAFCRPVTTLLPPGRCCMLSSSLPYAFGNSCDREADWSATAGPMISPASTTTMNSVSSVNVRQKG